MIISGIDICFVAHLNNMAEAYFLPDYEQCLLRTFTFANLILMTVLLFNCFKLFDNSFPTCFHPKLCRWKLVYRIRMYANAIQVSKCLMYTVSVHNIVWQY